MKLRNRLLAGLAALALIGSASAARATCSPGNLVAPATIGVADVQALLKCVGTRLSPPANPNPTVCNALCGGNSLATGVLSCGDVNLDGQITTADAVLVLNESAEANSRRNVVPICTSPGPTVPCGTTIDAADPNNINSNRQLSNCEYFVSGTVFVQPGVVLTIRPGAVIKGIAGAPTPSGLVFLAGDMGDGNPAHQCLPHGAPTRISARINAAGTPTSPILFTSDQPAGSRRSGDWAGVAFNGCSRVNDTGGTAEAEGLVGVSFGGGTDCKPGTQFEEGHAANGTADCADSSGLMRYARIEFGGNELSPDNELNSLTQNALGNHTNFSYLQTHMGLDDNFEWFGGTILEHHLVSTGARDDNFDWQLGSDNKLQYGVAAQYLPNLDTLGDNGFEGDNNERGFTNLEPSTPQFCNITLIGAKDQGTAPSGGSWYAALLRRGTPARIAKTILTNFISGGINMRDPETGHQACTGNCKVCRNTVPAIGCTSDATCGGGVGDCVTRTDGVTLTCNGGANSGKLCHAATDVADCGSSGLCTVTIDCPGSPFTLVDTDPFDTTCAYGPKAGQTCANDAFCAPSTCGYNNLLFTHSLFFDNGDGVSTHGSVSGQNHIANGVVKTGGNNTGSACNSHEWLSLLAAGATVTQNTTFPDAATNPGINAGPFWPPVSFVPTNTTLVTDSTFDCADMSTFFETTNYIGAFAPGAGTDWTQTAGHCSTTTATSCTTASGCPAGESCVRWISYVTS